MRGTGSHNPPERMQGRPIDNSSRWIQAQVNVWLGTVLPEHAGKSLIHTESAREIASWWQVPGNAFSAFASTGTILDGLAHEVEREIAETEETTYAHLKSVTDNRSALRALLAYIKACEIEV